MPAALGTCQDCAVFHDERDPHNQQSLYYQMRFKKEHDRWPTWIDAMAHCTQQVKDFWIAQLKEHGKQFNRFFVNEKRLTGRLCKVKIIAISLK